MERTDEYVTGVLLGWLSTPENVAMLIGQEDDWADRVTAAEARLAELQQRLDDAANEFAAGRIDVRMLSAVQQRLTPQIAEASAATVPPVSDQTVKGLINSADIEQAWSELELLEKRRLLKLLLDIRVGRAIQIGPKFNPDRIHITPRVSSEASQMQGYVWRE